MSEMQNVGAANFADGDDPTMVQPKFNIQETVEVVHNNAAANKRKPFEYGDGGVDQFTGKKHQPFAKHKGPFS